MKLFWYAVLLAVFLFLSVVIVEGSEATLHAEVAGSTVGEIALTILIAVTVLIGYIDLRTWMRSRRGGDDEAV